MNLSDAILAAADARKEGLLGKYPMAAQLLAEEVMHLREAIHQTLDDNGHLSDGDNCTLIHLVRAMETPNVKTSVPVCIVCMDEELTRLRKLAQASLDARDKEAKAAMSYECAKDDYTYCCKEAASYEKAMLAASRADAALRAELATPNV